LTTQATRKRRKVHRNLAGVSVRRRHVPYLLARVEIDGRFKYKPIRRKQVCRPAPALAAVVHQFPFTVYHGITRTTKAHPGFTRFFIDAKAYLRLFVCEFTWREVIDGTSARVSMGRARERGRDGLMAALTCSVPNVTATRRRGLAWLAAIPSTDHAEDAACRQHCYCKYLALVQHRMAPTPTVKSEKLNVCFPPGHPRGFTFFVDKDLEGTLRC